jgi:hypothetical protein
MGSCTAPHLCSRKCCTHTCMHRRTWLKELRTYLSDVGDGRIPVAAATCKALTCSTSGYLVAAVFCRCCMWSWIHLRHCLALIDPPLTSAARKLVTTDLPGSVVG